MVRKAVSYGLVGVLNTSVDAAVFFLVLKWVTDSLIVANLLGWVVAVSGSDDGLLTLPSRPSPGGPCASKITSAS